MMCRMGAEAADNIVGGNLADSPVLWMPKLLEDEGIAWLPGPLFLAHLDQGILATA